jgi:hypothetical protein
MQSCGIYTLANDRIYDQLVALLNSIEINVSSDIPVCIIPFDNQLEKIQKEIDSRPNVTLFNDRNSIQRWEDFAKEVVAAHPKAIATQFSHPRWHEGRLHRKFVTFDGPFDKFVFFDGDSLAMKPVDDVFGKLDRYDFVFDDWEHTKPESTAALNIPLIDQSGLFTEADIRAKLHCSSFFGSKRGLFDQETLLALKQQLIAQGEVAWINGNGWWDDAFLFNYMTLRCDRPLFNFTQSSNPKERTGNCANADPFVAVEVLYNREGLKPIHRIHYMGYSAHAFSRLCQGEDAGIRYQETFLSYRFCKQLDQRPNHLKKPNLLIRGNRLIQRVMKKMA